MFCDSAETQQWFDKNAPDWGFTEMISLTELHAEEGLLMNGELTVVAKVEVLEVVGKLDVSEESSPVIETIDVNGFQVLPSQVKKKIFKENTFLLFYILRFETRIRKQNHNLRVSHFLLSFFIYVQDLIMQWFNFYVSFPLAGRICEVFI